MGRDDRDVIVVEREGGGALKWLVVGAAVGAGLALLFAPKSGKEMRKDLGRRIKGLREFADETMDELKIEMGTEGPERPVPDGGTDQDDDEPAEPARPAVSGKAQAREELERRLAAARARRRQPTPDDEEPVA